MKIIDERTERLLRARFMGRYSWYKYWRWVIGNGDNKDRVKYCVKFCLLGRIYYSDTVKVP